MKTELNNYKKQLQKRELKKQVKQKRLKQKLKYGY